MLSWCCHCCHIVVVLCHVIVALSWCHVTSLLCVVIIISSPCHCHCYIVAMSSHCCHVIVIIVSSCCCCCCHCIVVCCIIVTSLSHCRCRQCHRNRMEKSGQRKNLSEQRALTTRRAQTDGHVRTWKVSE